MLPPAALLSQLDGLVVAGMGTGMCMCVCVSDSVCLRVCLMVRFCCVRCPFVDFRAFLVCRFAFASNGRSFGDVDKHHSKYETNTLSFSRYLSLHLLIIIFPCFFVCVAVVQL